MNHDLEKVKHYLLETMDYFHEFCETHNLEYFIIGGTLLGAIRHEGFIPWDDDIDVIMPKKDYKKILNLLNSIDSPYELLNYKFDKNYVYQFSRLANNNLILEEEYYKPFHCGAWIDIFPLDYTYKNPLLRKLQFTLVSVLKKILIIRTASFKRDKYPPIIYMILALLHKTTSILPKSIFFSTISLVQDNFPLLHKNKGKFFANFQGGWGVKESVPTQVFKEKTLYNFEGRTYWGPKDAHTWLSKVYGDYMKLPEESKRKSHHKIKVIKEVKNPINL